MMSRIRNGRRLEKAGNLNLEMHGVEDIGDEVCDQEGVPTQGEKVIADTDAFELEELGPIFGQCLFEGCARRDELWLHRGAARNP